MIMRLEADLKYTCVRLRARTTVLRRLSYLLVLTMVATVLFAGVPSAALCSGYDKALASVTFPGEQPFGTYPVNMAGKRYQPYCFTGGQQLEKSTLEGNVMEMTADQWKVAGITGLAMLRKGDSRAEVDQQSLRRAFDTLLFGYGCYFSNAKDLFNDSPVVIQTLKNVERSSNSLKTAMWKTPAIADRERELYKLALRDIMANPLFLASEATRENEQLGVSLQDKVNEIRAGTLSTGDFLEYLARLADTGADPNSRSRLLEQRSWLQSMTSGQGSTARLEIPGKANGNDRQVASVVQATLNVLDTYPVTQEQQDNLSSILAQSDSVKAPLGDELQGAMSDILKGVNAQKDLSSEYRSFLEGKGKNLLAKPEDVTRAFSQYLLKQKFTTPAALLTATLSSQGSVDVQRSLLDYYTNTWGKGAVSSALVTDVVYGYRIAAAMDKILATLSKDPAPAQEKGYDYSRMELYRSCYYIRNMALATCCTSLGLLMKEGVVKSPQVVKNTTLFAVKDVDASTLLKTGVDHLVRLDREALHPPAVNRAIAQSQARGEGNVQSLCTVLVVDTSGSMGKETSDGVVKIDAAKSAAKQVVSLMSLYGQQQDKAGVPTTDSVGLVSFSEQAKTVSGLTKDYTALNAAIDTLQPEDFTDMGLGIEQGISVLKPVSDKAQKYMVILSDGKITHGMDNQQVLSKLVPQLNSLGIKVYTIGFGDEELDEKFLQELAEKGGGKYFRAKDAHSLNDAYMQIRLSSLGEVTDWTGEVSQGQTASVGRVIVPDRAGELHAVLNWPGSQLSLKITDPSGKVVDQNYPGASIFAGKPIYIVVNKPRKGTWKFAVTGDQVNGKSSYFAAASVRMLPKAAPAGGKKSSNWWLILVLAILAVAVIGGSIAAILLLRKRERDGLARPGTPASRGIAAAEEPPTCPSCGKILQSDWNRCPYCNWDMSQQFVDEYVPELAIEPARPGDPEQVPPIPVLFGAQPAVPGLSQADIPDASEFQAYCFMDVVDGPGAGGYYVIDTELVNIGRDQDNHIVLDDTMTSAWHARLHKVEGGFFIEDLDSTNGTLVNGEPIVTAWLTEGSTITIGETVFMLRMPEFQGR
jgi:Mg-chelatase subunit ChlD